jgi:hypothetical protein
LSIPRVENIIGAVGRIPGSSRSLSGSQNRVHAARRLTIKAYQVSEHQDNHAGNPDIDAAQKIRHVNVSTR